MTTTPTGWSRPIRRPSFHGRLFGLEADGSLVVMGQADGVTFSAASGAANTCALTIQVVNPDGAAIAGVYNFDLWLSDAATGAGLTANANTSELTASTGALFAILTTEKAWRIQTDATGKAVVVITDTGKHTTYPCVALDGRGVTMVAAQLVTGNYG